jgi:hypothetical protein
VTPLPKFSPELTAYIARFAPAAKDALDLLVWANAWCWSWMRELSFDAQMELCGYLRGLPK